MTCSDLKPDYHRDNEKLDDRSDDDDGVTLLHIDYHSTQAALTSVHTSDTDHYEPSTLLINTSTSHTCKNKKLYQALYVMITSLQIQTRVSLYQCRGDDDNWVLMLLRAVFIFNWVWNTLFTMLTSINSGGETCTTSHSYITSHHLILSNGFFVFSWQSGLSNVGINQVSCWWW